MAAAEIAKSKIDAFAELGMAQTVKAVCEEIRRLYQWDQVPWVKQTSRMNARSRLSRSRCSKRRMRNSWQSSERRAAGRQPSVQRAGPLNRRADYRGRRGELVNEYSRNLCV